MNSGRHGAARPQHKPGARRSPRAGKGGDGRRWYLPGTLLVVFIIAATSWPIFSNPQIEADDYRYLHHVQRLESDFWGNIVAASVVENRWDHLWWISASGKIRFFRPAVVLSYWLDWIIYGDALIIGLLITNVLLHLACTLLAAVVFVRWFGVGLPALIGSALFAAFFCHGEVIYYVAGRTDTLGALGFLAGLALHVLGPRRPLLRWLALPCYAFALISKELTIALPVVCLLHDHLVERRGTCLKELLRAEWRLYTGYIGVAGVILVLRAVALSGGESSLIQPYFILPWTAEFPMHLWLQFRNYGENLLLAQWTRPFMQPELREHYTSSGGLALILTALCGVSLLCWNDRRFWLLLALGIMTWLPTSFVYLSERYLYLPSLAVAGLAGLALARLRHHKRLFPLGAFLGVLWAGHQGYRLWYKHDMFATAARPTKQITDQLRKLSPSFPRGAQVMILNLPPGGWVWAQFIEAHCRVLLDDPTLKVRVLTVMPRSTGMGAGMTMAREDRDSLVVVGGQDPKDGSRFPLLDHGIDEFAWVPLETGKKITGPRLGFDVEILSGQGDRCDALRFVFPKPLESYIFLHWDAYFSERLTRPKRLERGHVDVWRP